MNTNEVKEVKERPILFSAAMVRALLAGTKTQTRRVVKSPTGTFEVNSTLDMKQCWLNVTNEHEEAVRPLLCPYGQPGDRLWVRETLYWDECGEEWCYVAGNDPVMADPYTAPILLTEGRKAVPSIHMPREASRILLEIVSVRVERLQDISEADARAEGVAHLFTQAEIDKMKRGQGPCMYDRPEDSGYRNYLWHGLHGREGYTLTHAQIDAWPHQFSNYDTAVGSYSSLWASINGPDSWAANPWVWVVEFKRIDAEGKEVARG